MALADGISGKPRFNFNKKDNERQFYLFRYMDFKW